MLKVRFEHSSRFVEMGRVEDESTLIDLEMAVGLAYAALSEQEYLLARR